ncbi:Predicted thiol-disulfide oxidoreductase YuxK, DCC family [Maribacter sedimenticola]|uniref:Predicted thiol-disulfide oxidoreductase YuxK, DCC family n=1 Tax=Maribacter sedimenticola TaxID=228956 RepID=A0ABY1SGA5_9FLAO|nr:DCC1-like thiol-disulfide oxidoreductase family protein [Maribacter sedimenticola]SNR45011.1 Predicted thiol-disulfide oxidoreductase YuxK, DCC family [Maribacter sedimenticola]
MENKKKIILFDGVCNLCNGAVQFIIKRDSENQFQFAALQSETGKKLTLERNIDTEKVDSIILIEPNVAYYIKSTAALKIGEELKGIRTISSILLWLPESFRNIVYDFIARNRYQWYGKREECMIPTDEIKQKFI